MSTIEENKDQLPRHIVRSVRWERFQESFAPTAVIGGLLFILSLCANMTNPDLISSISPAASSSPAFFVGTLLGSFAAGEGLYWAGVGIGKMRSRRQTK